MATSILVPTYFGNKMVENCISSLLRNVNQPKIVLYKNDIGWLKACNELMFQNHIFGNVVLLNDDTIVLTDIIKAFDEVAASDPKIGIIGGVALAPNADTVINYGIYVGVDGNTAHKHYGKRVDELPETEKQKAVEGSCMWINRKLIEEIGLFDPNYGMGYREEVDFCFTAREAGWKVVSTNAARYIHFVSQTNSKVGIANDKYDYFMSKWGTKLQLGKV